MVIIFLAHGAFLIIFIMLILFCIYIHWPFYLKLSWGQSFKELTINWLEPWDKVLLTILLIHLYMLSFPIKLHRVHILIHAMQHNLFSYLRAEARPNLRRKRSYQASSQRFLWNSYHIDIKVALWASFHSFHFVLKEI